jgi:hypothetical protein
MSGGLLNLISIGQSNVILTGNPTKTFFKVAYNKYSNFGLQKFRLDYGGSRDLRLTEESKFTFTIKKYGDLLMDTYVVVTLPDIFSPIYPPTPETNYQWSSYDFKFIENIGIQMIKEITINSGSVQLQKYSGSYLANMIERDFTKDKKDLFNKMSGNIPEFTDPANAFGRKNAYPSSYYTSNPVGTEPSIRGKTLYIPINTSFTLDSRCAFPLIALQYNELTITVTIRPINELFQIRDVFDSENGFPYIKPNFNEEQNRMYRFLQTPPAVRINVNTTNPNLPSAYPYEYTQQIWNADIHLLATYAFLSDTEQRMFAKEDQVYLVKNVIEYNFYNVTGTKKLKLENSNNMVSSWMFFLQRNDVNMRNEWSNYSNWPYEGLPQNVSLAPYELPDNINDGITDVSMQLISGPRTNPGLFGENSGLFTTGDYCTYNQKEILLTMGILLEGAYREDTLQSGIFDYVEKYTRTPGNAKEGLYCYNFCLSTNQLDYQPSGAINLSKFKNIEFEITTYTPQIDPTNIAFKVICSTDGNPIAVSRKPGWQLYQYNYNMTIYEERYNIMSFIGGNVGLMYAL